MAVRRTTKVIEGVTAVFRPIGLYVIT